MELAYDFSTLYTTSPHNLIKDKLNDLIERIFQREGSPYLACNDRNAFFTSEKPKNIIHGLIKMHVIDALDNICIRFGTKLYRHVVGIPMGTYCAPVVANLFVCCSETGLTPPPPQYNILLTVPRRYFFC